MRKIIYTSDIENLVKTFIHGKVEIHLFDPEELIVEDKELDNFRRAKFPRVLVNMTAGSLESTAFETFDYIIDFGALYALELGDFKKGAYKFINNGDGTIRYLFPKDQKTADFLSLSPKAPLTEKVKVGVEKYLFGIRFFRWMISGEFSLYHKHDLLEPETARDFGASDELTIEQQEEPKMKVAKERSFASAMSFSAIF